MAESELHFLRARMRGGILAKARRGELALALPVGLAYDHHGQVVLDPDAGVRHAVHMLFDTFTATGSAFGVVKSFREQQLTFPARHRRGPRRGELFFQPLTHDRVLSILHNPAYAGAYAYGRARHTTDLDGHHHTTVKPIQEWTVLIKDHHPGYLTWPRHEANLAILTANAAAHGEDRAAGPPREGAALLQGLAVCGRCGRRMTIRYHSRHGAQIPDYVCQNDGIRTAQPICQHLTGDIIDSAVSDLILTTLTPAAIEVSLAVSDELIAQAERADQLRRAHVQRAEQAADAARHRYLAVDAANRLVADTLEADWNTALRALAAARDDYRKATATATALDQQQRDKIRALAVDLPALWNDPGTPMRDRKRLIRLLITDVTLTRGQDTITAAIRFPGGGHHILHLPVPLNAWQLRKTPDDVIELIDQLLDDHTFAPIADILNTRQAPHGGIATPWTGDHVASTATNAASAATTSGSATPACSPSTRSPSSSPPTPRASNAGTNSASSPASKPTTAASSSTTPARPAPPAARSKKPANDSATTTDQAAATPTAPPAAPEMSEAHATIRAPRHRDHHANPDTAQHPQEVQCEARSFVQSTAKSRVNRKTCSL